MRPTVAKVRRFDSMHGWANRILRVDLTSMRIEVEEAAPYLPDYLGARGLAARICWNEYPQPVPPFDAANPLMIFPGALTGSRSPYSGRTSICAFSPQAYPHAWFTRSSVGARFGGELKRAGYDGLIVTGVSQTHVRLRIRDDEVSILPAGDLWGQDTMDTLETLESIEGRGVQSLVIGPAGERLSCIATIHAASSSASGQGGFGGVMGSKNLKAISVIGSGRVSLASPEIITSISRTLAVLLAEDGEAGPRFFDRDLGKLNRHLAAKGDGRARCQACTEACLTPCAACFQDVPGVVHNRSWSGSWFCVGAICFPGSDEETPSPTKGIFGWHLDRRAAFEMNVLSNRYGLNQFDLLVGMVPWLIACQNAGLISELNGQQIDWRSPAFWAGFLHAIAYRKGLGDVLAEGGWVAAQKLDLGLDLARRRYAGWGHAGHWDGHEGYEYPFPFWLVSALQWMSDTRDPFSTGHGSLWPAYAAARAAELETRSQQAAAFGQIRAISSRVYGSPEAADPFSGYEEKAHMGFFHTVRPVIKDCLPVDDLVFPLIYARNAPDRYWRLPHIDGVGDIEGPSVEAHLFRAGTGLGWPADEFQRAAERICTLERALHVRHWGRNRQTDEMVLPYFEEPELHPNPLLGNRQGLDRDKFKPVMDQFYQLHGWDVETGWPTPERLRQLGLDDVYQPMIEGRREETDAIPSDP